MRLQLIRMTVPSETGSCWWHTVRTTAVSAALQLPKHLSAMLSSNSTARQLQYSALLSATLMDLQL
jgi:hypothetical protein